VAQDELVIAITAKDQASAEARDLAKEVRDLAKAIKQADAAGDTDMGLQLRRQYDIAGKASAEAQVRVKKFGAEVKRLERTTLSSTKRVQSAWSRMKGVVSSPLFTAATIAGIAYFGKRAVEAFAEAERSQLQLQLAFQKFPAINDVTAESFAALNMELMNMTGADDDLLAAAEGLLARFKLTGTEIQTLIPLVNDYAIATGRNIPDAASAVGKALMGNARAMKELGVDFKVTGDRSADLERLMGALERKVGGVGEAFGQTTAGKLAIAQENFGNLQEEIGAALVPALEALVSVVKPISETFAGMSDSSKKLAVGLGVIGAAALVLVPRLVALRAQLAIIQAQTGAGGAAMLGMGARGRKAAVGIAALGTALIAMRAASNNGDVFTYDNYYNVDEFGRAIRDIVQPGVIGGATNAVAGFIDTMVPFNTRLDDAKTRISELDTELTDWVSQGRMDDAANKVDVLTRESEAWGATSEDILALLPGYSAAIKANGDAASGAAPKYDALGAAAGRAKGAMSDLDAAIEGVNKALMRKQAFDDYRAALKEYIKDPTDATASAAASAMTAYATSIGKPERKAKEASKAAQDLLDVASQSGYKMDPSLERSLQGIVDTADAATSAINSIPTTKTIAINYSGNAQALVDRNGNGIPDVLEAAHGGYVGGLTGGPTSDTVPALLSRGEFVVRAGAVQALGLEALERINKADRIGAGFTAPTLTMTSPDREPALVGAGAPVINIGEIRADSGIDVQTEVLWALRRSERIRRERG
jgi:hypothetical protein